MQKEQRDFKGVWMPKEIYLSKDLGWSEKILFIEIDSLDNKDGCFASNTYFAEFLGKSEARISQIITKLKRMGLIEQTDFNGRKRVLRVMRQTHKKLVGRLIKNYDHSNISNNIEEREYADEPLSRFLPLSSSPDEINESRTDGDVVTPSEPPPVGGLVYPSAPPPDLNIPDSLSPSESPPVSAPPPFELKVYLDMMLLDSRPHIKLISLLFSWTELDFPSEAAVKSAIRQNVKAASDIIKGEWDFDLIQDTLEWMMEQPFYKEHPPNCATLQKELPKQIVRNEKK